MHTFITVLSLVLFSTLSFASPAPLEIRVACLCENSRALNIKQCTSFCSKQKTPGRYLHLFITPSVDTLLQANLGAVSERFATLLNFCVTPRGDTTNPSCDLVAIDERGIRQRIPFDFAAAHAGHAQINARDLRPQTNYTLFIQEYTSGAKSTEWTLSY